MPADTKTSSILAKGADSGSTASPSSAVPTGERLLAPDARPDQTVDEVLALLGEERYATASRLAAEAVVRFPDHARVRNVWSVFDCRGKASAGPQASEPSREEEFEWLRDPPESVRGKWVALLGNELIGAAQTLVELERSLDAKVLPQPALVHFVD